MSHSPEDDDVLRVLQADGGWVNINALWNRTSIRHKTVCSAAVGRLIKLGKVQKRMTRIGEEYALPGAGAGRDLVQPPAVTHIDPAGYVPQVPARPPGPVSMPNVTVPPLRAALAVHKPPPPKAEAAATPPHIEPAPQISHRYDVMVAALRERPGISGGVLAGLCGYSQVQTSRDLLHLVAAGRVIRHGSGRATRFTAVDIAAPVATAAGATPAVQPTVTDNGGSSGGDPPTGISIAATEPASPRHGPLLNDRERCDIDGTDDCSFALFSDGRLLVDTAELEIKFTARATRKLLAFLDGTLVREVA